MAAQLRNSLSAERVLIVEYQAEATGLRCRKPHDDRHASHEHVGCAPLIVHRLEIGLSLNNSANVIARQSPEGQAVICV